MRWYTAADEWRVFDQPAGWTLNQMYVDELRHFVGCVRGELERPMVDGEQGAAVLAVALAALRSATEGRTIDVGDEDATTRAWLSRLGRRP